MQLRQYIRDVVMLKTRTGFAGSAGRNIFVAVFGSRSGPPPIFGGTDGIAARFACRGGSTMEVVMADREIHTHTTDSGSGGMGAILGMILGVLLVGGLIFFFASNWNGGSSTKLTVNAPSAPSMPSTTGSAPSPAR
jgi:hypothetical protein